MNKTLLFFILIINLEGVIAQDLISNDNKDVSKVLNHFFEVIET